MSIYGKNDNREYENEGFEEEPNASAHKEKIDVERNQVESVTLEILRISEMQGQKRYQDKLIQTLQITVDDNKFKPSRDAILYKEKSEIEQIAGINFDDRFLTLGTPFVAYWQGHYRSSTVRFALLRKLIEEEKVKKNDKFLSLKDRMFEWIKRYFEGCALEGMQEVSGNQNPDAVIAMFEQDCDLVQQLPLSDSERQEVIRHLRIDFLEGAYPIDIHKNDQASKDTMRREIQQLAERRNSSENRHLTPVGIAMAMQRYRENVAQGLDHESEMIKRREEGKAINAMHEQEFERLREDYFTELEFLESLDLPEFEREEWPLILKNAAYSPSFQINRETRESTHTFVRSLAEETSKNMDNNWSVIIRLLIDYWAGHYFPSPLREMVFKNEMKLLLEEASHAPNLEPLNTNSLTKKFVSGGSSKSSKINAAQDPILIGRAYQRDMKLIRDLGFGPKTTRKIEWEYNDWFLQGNLPLAVDRETPEDRQTFEKEIHDMAEECKRERHISTIDFLQKFCDYWLPIAKRLAPRKQ